MVNYMKVWADKNMKESFSQEHRTLLADSFKNVIGTKRASWRIIGQIQTKIDNKEFKGVSESDRSWQLNDIANYRKQIADDILKDC